MRVLIIEDEKDLARVVGMELELQGMEVAMRHDGASGLAAALEGDWNLVVLDWMLPDLEGIEVCRLLRARKPTLPIIMVTAKQGVSNEVRGLEEGADDYLVKPFDMELLSARIKALARRSGVPADSRLCYADLVLDADERTVTKAGAPVKLTNKEYGILRLLMANRGKVMTKEAIFAAVWGDKVHLEEGVLAVHVKAIRTKLGGRYVENVRGVGYLLPRDDSAPQR